jgi:eukaryotic-like serine/threonine-protein kinase
MHGVGGAGRLLAGRYRLDASIGRGAMGIVWRGRDELLERDVAVKEVRVPAMVSSGDAGIVYQRTLREAKTAARLNHPGVVTVFDVVEEDGSPWIVMELVQARALDQIVTEEGPLRPLAAARVGECLLSALRCAHSAGVLHRDVKPSNVLIDAGGRAVLTDFGIAKFEGDPGLTQVGMVVGTPGFTAPERLRGRPATPASDLWSLGATLYAAVEGRGPFERAGGPAAVMAGVVNEKAPRAPSAGPLMPVIDALLRTDPGARPDAATAARLLSEAAEGAKAGLTLPGYPWPYSAVAGGTGRGGGPGSAGVTGPDGVTGRGDLVSPSGPGNDATTTACPVPPGPPVPGSIPAFMIASASPNSQAAPGQARLPDSADLPAFLDMPGFLNMPKFDDQPPLPPDLAASWSGQAGPPPGPPQRPAPGPKPRTGRALAASLAALVVLAAGLLLGLTYANSGGQSSAQGAAGLNLGAIGKAAGPGRPASGNGATVPAGHGSGTPSPGTSNAGTTGTATGPTGTAGGKPKSAAGPGPAPSTPAPVSAPAGYRWYSVPAASGATAGFTIAVPDTWQATTQGLITHVTSPAGDTHVEISQTPFFFANPVREARLQQRQAIRQDLFPGYLGLGITPGIFHGAADAVWQFSWQPGDGRMPVRDVLVSLDTSAGEQPYALSVSAPRPDAPAAVDVFQQMLETFQPVP